MAEPFRYRIYGLCVHSEVRLAGLIEGPAGEPDVRVRRVECIDASEFTNRVYETPALTTAGIPYLAIDAPDDRGSALLMTQSSDIGSVQFCMQSRHEIAICLRGSVDPGDLRAYFIGPVLGHLLRLKRTTALHGGFVESSAGAVGVVGGKGAGKSSLVGAWAHAGLPVISDDIGALSAGRDGQWIVAAGYPQLRLWPDSARELALTPPGGGERVLSFSEKIYVDLDRDGLSFEDGAHPLHAIVVLDSRDGPGLQANRLPAGSALVNLLSHVYAPKIGGRLTREADLRGLTDLCRSVPVYRVSLPASFDWLRDQSLDLLDRLK